MGDLEVSVLAKVAAVRSPNISATVFIAASNFRMHAGENVFE